MKKRFIVPLTLGFLALGLAACNEVEPTPTPEPAHTHSYVKEVVKENYLKDAATCTTPASYFKSCECGEKGSETFTSGEALGHTEVVDAAVAATCTEKGKTEGKHCSVCEEVLVAQEEVAALGHTEAVDAAVAATCTEKGKTEGKHCSVCEEVLVAQEEVAALGHTEVVDAAVAATCTEKGKTEGKHCSVCEEVLVAQEEVAALGHTEVVDAAVAATCITDGLTEGKHCSVCEEVLVAQEVVPATGEHVIEKGECTTEGCEFKEEYTFAVATEEHGATTSDLTKEHTNYGDEITLTFTPEQGYELVSYTVTVGDVAKVIPALGATTATLKVEGNTTVVGNYDVAGKYTSFTVKPDGNGALLWFEKDGVEGAWASGTSGTSERDYEYVIDRVRGGSSSVKLDPNFFDVSAKTAPSLNGKWANFSSDSDSYDGKEICLFGAEGEKSSMTFTSEQHINSIVITYANSDNVKRAAIYAGETALEGAKIDGKTYSYSVEGNSFTIENVGHDYLYMYAIKVVYEAPQRFDTNTEISLLGYTEKVEGAKAEWNNLYIDATNGKFALNESQDWVQFNTGAMISLRVAADAEVTPVTYQGSTAYAVTYANGYATITATDNIYIKAINVAYPVVFDSNTTIDLAAFDGKYEGNTGKWNGLSVDATNGKFADNGDWVQVNTGTIITFNVAENAQIALTTYQDAKDYTVVVEEGVATITTTGNIYIGSIAVSYPTGGETEAKLNQSLNIDALYAELFPSGEKRGVESATDKALVPNDTKAFEWVDIEGTVQLRSNDSDNKLEIAKNETGAISYKVTGKVKITVQVASTSKTNSSSFALKVGEAYVACDQDATALAGTVASKKIVGPEGAAPVASTLYELSGTDSVYLVYGSGDGVTVTFTIDASAIEGGQKVSFVSPDAGFGRGLRVLSFSVEEVE